MKRHTLFAAAAAAAAVLLLAFAAGAWFYGQAQTARPTELAADKRVLLERKCYVPDYFQLIVPSYSRLRQPIRLQNLLPIAYMRQLA